MQACRIAAEGLVMVVQPGARNSLDAELSSTSAATDLSVSLAPVYDVGNILATWYDTRNGIQVNADVNDR